MRPETRASFDIYKEKAYSIGYHKKRCEEIKSRVSKITLPTLNNTKIREYRNILDQANKKYTDISKKELHEKFLDTIELIHFLYSTTGDKELREYIIYIIEYEYVITKILESKRSRISQNTIANSINILRTEIEQFVAKFTRVAEGEVETRSREDMDDILYDTNK